MIKKYQGKKSSKAKQVNQPPDTNKEEEENEIEMNINEKIIHELIDRKEDKEDETIENSNPVAHVQSIENPKCGKGGKNVEGRH